MASPYHNTHRWNPAADNAWLVRQTTKAARTAWPLLELPRDLFTREDAARVAYAFARDQVQYIREDGDQLIRYPWRTLADGRGDCKSLAVLIASICAAAGCRVDLAFVAYEGEDWYGHVFAVVDGVAVDPELQFGDEVLYSHRIDKRIR